MGEQVFGRRTNTPGGVIGLEQEKEMSDGVWTISLLMKNLKIT